MCLHFMHLRTKERTNLVYRADDKSSRYVAEENIERLYWQPCESLMQQAGRYFKRWDREKKVFISNIADEYPED